MEEKLDPYEKQLLAVFRSCDNSGNGVLDQSGYTKLCDTLQLEDVHRNQLSSRLCVNGKCNIVFNEFKDALLAVLASYKSPTEEYPSPNQELVESPEQEISPKFEFGGKKYGRRSRPVSTDQDEKVEKCLPSNKTNDIFCSEDGYGNELSMETDYQGNKSKDVNIKDIKEDEDLELEAFCKRLGVHEK